MTTSTQPTDSPADSAQIAAIVRLVMQRLAGNPETTLAHPTNQTAVSISDRVITVATIESVSGHPSQVFVDMKAIVTPAAKDEAARRGIEITRSVEIPLAMQPQTKANTNAGPINQFITDSSEPNRAIAAIGQLSARGINAIGCHVVLSDTPAVDLHRIIANQGKRAAMVAAMADVGRFAAELDPEVWVLDMKKLNLVAAVNAVARIAKS